MRVYKMSSPFKKIVGATAIGAISIVELLHLQQASATPVSFTGSTYQNPRGGNVQVSITVDGASGIYTITGISTPVQPTGQNASYANYAIPTLVTEALAAQSASISGVSGASQISAAWKSSLSSAIAAAAAAGEVVGQASVAPTPTPSASTAPTPGATTPVPGATTPAGNQGPTVGPVPTAIPTSVAVAPTYYPLNLPGYVATTTGPNLTSYLTQISNILSLLSRNGGEGSSTSLTNARNALTALQAQVTSDSTLSPSASSFASYVAFMNTQIAFVTAQANQAIADYYAKVKIAANKLFVDAQASAAAVSASPAPTVTVTVTATPTPTPSAVPAVVYKPGGVIKKTFKCVKTVAGKTTTKTLKAVIVKCPTGFKLLKK